MITKPKFIGTQRLLRLRCEPGDELSYLEPGRFRLRRMKQRGSNLPDADSDPQTADDDDAWVQVGEGKDDRERFLTDPDIDHLCITIGGGVGKTCCASQIRYLRQEADPDQLVALVDVSDLPYGDTQAGLADKYLDQADTNSNLLVDSIRRQATRATNGATSRAKNSGNSGTPAMSMNDCTGVSAEMLIRRKIRQGKFTLIVDGLDQIDMADDRAAKAVMQGLQQFLSHYPATRCVVLGRPWSVQHFWSELFGHVNQAGRWTFAQIDEFNKAEVKEYLGEKRFAALELLEADLMAVPRFLERLRRITPKRLAQLRTGAEVYWESLGPMLQAGCDRQAAAMTPDDAIPALALLAFQMITERKSVRVRPGKEFTEFRKAALKRGGETLGVSTLPDFKTLLSQVASLNVGLQHLLMDNRELREIHWQDRTLQAFMAAIWVTRYASPDDLQWLSQHLHVHGDESTEFVHEMWRFACEMPSDEGLFPDSLPLVYDESSYVAAMSLLLGTATDGVQPVRSTEMIYRCWPTMLRLSGLLNKPAFTEQNVLVATELAQQIACEERPAPDAQNIDAQAKLLVFLREYPAIRSGPKGDAAAKIAQGFEDSFRPVPAGSADPLGFWMSSETFLSGKRGETHRSQVDSAFRLSAFQLTNEVYGLFDCDHASRHSGYLRYQTRTPDNDQLAHPRCPAVYLTWYDAWVAGVWLHSRLPSEIEWEYACRDQTFAIGDTDPPLATLRYDDVSDDLLGDHAWFSGNSEDRAHPVGQKSANGSGLHDLYGNVWEWTQSWYASDVEAGREESYRAGSRVSRGGSFSSSTDFCRSAYRLIGRPSNCSVYDGVRLARARKS